MKRLLIILFLVTSCGGSTVDTGENYGNLLNTAQGLVLTQGEHSIGWGKSECTMCHNLENIHLIDRTGVSDVAAIHKQTLTEGISGCAACHGTNGVP